MYQLNSLVELNKYIGKKESNLLYCRFIMINISRSIVV